MNLVQFHQWLATNMLVGSERGVAAWHRAQLDNNSMMYVKGLV